MARSTVWDKHWVGLGWQTAKWDFPNVSSVTVTYHNEGAKSQHMYKTNGEILVSRGLSTNIGAVNSITMFAGGQTSGGGYVSIEVEYGGSISMTAADVYANQGGAITLTGSLSSYTYVVTWSAQGVEPYAQNLSGLTGESYTFQIDNPAWLKSVAKANKTANSVVVTVTCDAYKNSTKECSATASFTLNCYSTDTGATVSPISGYNKWYSIENVFTDSGVDYYLTNHTCIHVRATLSSEYADIVSWVISGPDTYLTGTSSTVDEEITFLTAGVKSLVITVYDSRNVAVQYGMAAEDQHTFIAYTKPQAYFMAYRCAEGAPNIAVASGNRIGFNVTLTQASSIKDANGNELNAVLCMVHYRREDIAEWSPTVYGCDENHTGAISAANYYMLQYGDFNDPQDVVVDNSSAYIIQLTAWDRVTSTSTTYKVTSANVFMRMEYDPTNHTSALGIGAYPTNESKNKAIYDSSSHGYVSAQGVVYIDGKWNLYTHDMEIVDLIKTIIANPNYPNTN